MPAARSPQPLRRAFVPATAPRCSGSRSPTPRTDAVKDDLVAGRTRARNRKAINGWESGWVLLALQNAFCHLRRGATVEDALVATVGKGGDTDTNAAIAGALLGAADGLGAIPAPLGLAGAGLPAPRRRSAPSSPGP